MLLDLVLVFILIVCFITDLRHQIIYNKVIFPGLILALILNVFYSGFSGLKFSLIGFSVGLGILLIPYLMGGFGAGDVKLLALIGALKGSLFVLNTALYMAVIGGIIALVIIIFNRCTVIVLKQVFLWIYSLISGVRCKLEINNSVSLNKYPYGIAIVAGAMICLFFKGAWVI
jgi:prepilin peptidase CpaA